MFLMLPLAPPQVRRGAFIAEEARIAGRMVEKTRSAREEKGEKSFFFCVSLLLPLFLRKKCEGEKSYFFQKLYSSSVSDFATLSFKSDASGCSAAPSASEAPVPRVARASSSSRTTGTGAETEEEEQSSPPCSTPPTATMAPWRLRGARVVLPAVLLVKRTSPLRPPVRSKRERDREKEEDERERGRRSGDMRERPIDHQTKRAPLPLLKP